MRCLLGPLLVANIAYRPNAVQEKSTRNHVGENANALRTRRNTALLREILSASAGRIMSDVLFESLEDGLLTLTLNRPERRNALNPAILEALLDATRRAASNTAVAAVLLTGAGGTFCVGGDVKAMATREARPIPLDDRIED